MSEDHHRRPDLITLLRKLAVSALGAFQNRGELLVVELQQERGRLFELLAWVVALLFFSVMATLLATAIIIFLIPEDYRLYAAAGFTLFYLAGALWSAFIVHRFLTRVPFPETVAQVKKDRAWLESFK